MPKRDSLAVDTNTLVFVIMALSMQDFAIQVLRHTNRGRVFDDTAYTAIRALCLHNLKDIAAQGVPSEQEATALNEALRLFPEMMDLTMALGRV